MNTPALRAPVAAAVAVLTSLALAAPASAGAKVVDQRDPTGDVKLLKNPSALTDAEKQSIDLSRFSATRRADAVRFSWKLGAVTSSTAFDQLLSVTFQGTGDAAWVMLLNVIPEEPRFSEVIYSPTLDGDDAVFCRPKVEVRGSTVRADVPLKCIPTKAGVMRVSTATGDYSDDDIEFSSDSLRVTGRPDLR